MAHAEQRQYIFENHLLVTCEIAVILNNDEVYRPGEEGELHDHLQVHCAKCGENVEGTLARIDNPVGDLIPTDKQEVVFGVSNVQYKKDGTWEDIDVNIADLIKENLELMGEVERLTSKLNAATRRLQLVDFEENVEVAGAGS